MPRRLLPRCLLLGLSLAMAALALSCGSVSSSEGGADAGIDADMTSADAGNDAAASDTARDTTVSDAGGDTNALDTLGTDTATGAFVDGGADGSDGNVGASDGSDAEGGFDSGNTVDARPDVRADTGTDADSEAGSPDSGSNADADASTEAGADGGSTAGGTDAAPDASGEAEVPLCVDNTTMCAGLQPLICLGGAWRNNGVVCDTACTAGTCICNVGNATKCQGLQPFICQNGFWVTNGGVCGYACTVGACTCNDVRFTPGSGGNSVLDSVTGETWYLVSNGGNSTLAQSVCASSYPAGRLPHESELLGILAQQANNVLCLSWNIDADIYFSQLSPDWYWTDTVPTSAPGGGPEEKYVVNLQTGAVGVRVANQGGPLTICVSP
jgi:hypothetical protein